MSVNDLIAEGLHLLVSNKIDEAITKFNQVLKEIEDKNSQFEEQNKIQYWLGSCYFNLAMEAKDAVDTTRLFTKAIAHYENQLYLAKQLEDEQKCIQEQSKARRFLDYCYFIHANKTKFTGEAKKLLKKAVRYYKQQLELVEQIKNKEEYEKMFNFLANNSLCTYPI